MNEKKSTVATIKFACPSCGQTLETEVSSAGEIISCPICQESMEVPQASPPPSTSRSPSSTEKKTVVRKRTSSIVSRNPAAPASQPGRKKKKTASSAKRNTPAYPPPAVPRRQKNNTGKIIAVFILLAALGGGAYWYITSESGKEALASVSSGIENVTGSIPSVGSGGGSAPIRPDSAEGPQAIADARGWSLENTAKVQTFQFGGSGSTREELTAMVARGDGRIVMTGILSDPNGVNGAGKMNRLVDSVSGEEYAFVAELSADGSTMNWISVFGADLLHPASIALGPDGTIVLGGKIRDRMKSVAGRDAGEFKGRTSIVIKLSADGSNVEWMREGGPNQSTANSVVVDKKGRVLFSGGTIGNGMTSYIIRKNADGSPSTFPNQPSGREWAIDFDVRQGQFLEEGQVGAFYELDKASPDGYDYDGPGGWGPTWFKISGIRQNTNLVIMPNGDIVASGTLYYVFRVKGTKSFPAFDTIVARWTSDGDLIWSSNLYQEGDGVHTPDQKEKDIVYNPVNGDLYVLVGQHGSNVYRFKGKLYGDTGNLFISWIGRVDSETGKIKDGWYWHNSRNTGYGDNGIPVAPPYPRLAGNRASELAVDSQGNIYFAGGSGAKAWTTPNAWKAWPQDKTGGGNASLTVLSPDLKIKYATQILGSEHGKSAANTLVVTNEGVWVGGRNGSAGFANASVPWSQTSVKGENDASIARFQFD